MFRTSGGCHFRVAASPFSQELRLREAGVQRDNVYRDIGVSGAAWTGVGIDPMLRPTRVGEVALAGNSPVYGPGW